LLNWTLISIGIFSIFESSILNHFNI
jgi:hypothetical protein